MYTFRVKLPYQGFRSKSKVSIFTATVPLGFSFVVTVPWTMKARPARQRERSRRTWALREVADPQSRQIELIGIHRDRCSFPIAKTFKVTFPRKFGRSVLVDEDQEPNRVQRCRYTSTEMHGDGSSWGTGRVMKRGRIKATLLSRTNLIGCNRLRLVLRGGLRGNEEERLGPNCHSNDRSHDLGDPGCGKSYGPLVTVPLKCTGKGVPLPT